MAYVCIVLLIIAYNIYKFYSVRKLWRAEVGWVKRTSWRNPGYIYFFCGLHEPFYKIKMGRTNNPFRRLKTHRTSKAHGVRIIALFQVKDDVKAEATLRKFFVGSRIRGDGEWYYLTLGMWLVIQMLIDRKLTWRVQSWLR